MLLMGSILCWISNTVNIIANMDKSGMTEFQKFLVREMERRDLSQNGLADFLGIASATMSRHMRMDGTAPEPSIDLLSRLHEKTGTSFLTLLSIAYPDLPPEYFSDLKPLARLIAERIATLPPDQQMVIDNLILSFNKAEKNG